MQVHVKRMLAWLSNPDGASFLSEGTARLGMDPAAFAKMLEKCMLNPQVMGGINSVMQNVDFPVTQRYISQSLSPQYGNGGAQASVRHLDIVGLLNDPAFDKDTIIENLSAQPGFLDAFASCFNLTRGMGPPPPPDGTVQDVENVSRIRSQVAPAVEQALAAAGASIGQPSAAQVSHLVLAYYIGSHSHQFWFFC